MFQTGQFKHKAMSEKTSTFKWSIIIPLSVSVISITFNFFQYFDKRGLEKEKTKIEIQKAKSQAEHDKIARALEIKIRNLDLRNKEMEMNAKLPNFEVSYFAMSYETYGRLSNQTNDKKDSGLVKGHPLTTSKYQQNNIAIGNAQYVMVLMIKQIGSSRADNVKVEYDAFTANKLGFSHQSEIMGLLKNLKTSDGAFRLGEIDASQSVVIPLFVYNENQQGMHDSFSITGQIYIPRYIEFTDIEGKTKKIEIRKMLENSFSVTVDVDQLG